MHIVATEKAAAKLARLVLSLEEPLFIEGDSAENLKETSTVLLSDEEISIFSNLPLSQNHPNYKPKKLVLKSKIYNK